MKIKILNEKKLNKQEKKKFKKLKKDVPKEKFTDRYGKEKGEDIFYGAITNMAKKEEEQIEEVSSMAGGNVGGSGQGTPIGTEEDIIQDNKAEEERARLKEMFSSSGQRGYLTIKVVSAEKEHAGHVERSQHQGLRNVMEDDDKTDPMEPRVPSPLEPGGVIANLLKKSGYKIKKELGSGQYGDVVLATEIDVYGGHDFAIKILKPGDPTSATRELRNYNAISKAREGNPLISKHFPEVFKIFKDGGYDFIVMEVLEPLHSELKGIFSGVEQLMHRQRPMSATDWPISKFDQDKDVSKRAEQALRDPEQLEDLVQRTKKSLENFSAAFGETPSPEVQKDIDIAMQSRTFINFFSAKHDREKLNNLIYKFQDEIIDYIGDSSKMYMAIFDDLKNSPYSNLFVTLMCKKIVDVMKKHTQHPANPEDWYDKTEAIKANTEYIIQSFLERFQKFYRFSTSLKGGYSAKDIGQKGGRMPDAESIYQAIMELRLRTGLFARDLHDGNAMRRPPGDIVIVDVGMFKTEDEINQMKKKGIRENRIRIKLKR